MTRLTLSPAGGAAAMALLLLLAAAPARAQGPDGRADFRSYVPRLEAVRIDDREAPAIDGDLSDPAWAKAATTDEFYQVEPNEGAAPTERTRVRIMYDSDTIYVGFHLYDSEPDKITAKLMARDSQLRNEDSIRVMFDPFGTFRDGFFFGTNPNGARVDALIENSSAIRVEWNTIWNVKSKIVEDGWIAEFAIPFRSISVDSSLKEWGLQFLRFIPRKNEETRWSNIDRTRDRIDLTNPGRLSGVENVQTGIGLEAQLFVTGASAYDWEAGEIDLSLNPSANIFYKITPSLTGSLTFNTDFADAPLDARQVNTGRFALFFPETRDFFLQDVASFEYGGAVFAENVNGLPFFSRRIGIVDGRPVDIVAGAKVSGKLGPANLGALAVRTGGDDLAGGQYLGAARASFPVLNESKVGAVFTYGDPSGAIDNSVAGVDFQYQNTTRFDGALTADFAYLRSFGGAGAIDADDQFGAAEAAYRGDKWNWTTRFEHIGEDYRPALGFANRTGIRRYVQDGWRRFRPSGGAIRFIEVGGFADVITDLDDTLLDRFWGGFVNVQTQAGDEFETEFLSLFEDIREPFDIAGRLNVPAGVYRHERYTVSAAMTEARAIAARAEVEFGGAFGGDFLSVETGLSWRPGKRFRVGAEYELTTFDLPTGSLDVHVGALESVVAFSPTLFIATDIQYDNISENFTFFSRLTWEPRPEREIFISFGHTALIEEDRFPTSFRAQGSNFAVRLGHTFRL
jgi:hypothetical protein